MGKDKTERSQAKTNKIQQGLKKIKKLKLSKKKVSLSSMLIIILLLIIVVVLIKANQKDNKAEIITSSTLQKIINVSDLNTFEAIYNGIAEVHNEKKPEKIDFYVSYNARVKAGIDFEDIEIFVDNQEKIITVIIPPVKINDVEVDITSLDYIFMNDKANKSGVSERAYKKCCEDVTAEANAEDTIFELGKQNAESIITALIKPFISQLDSDYILEIRHGGNENEENN